MTARAYLGAALAVAGLAAMAGAADATPSAHFDTNYAGPLLGGDDSAAQVYLPFAVTFFGQSYRTMNIDTNGFVTLGPTPSEIQLGAEEWNPTVADFVGGPARIAPQWFDWVSSVDYDLGHPGEVLITWSGSEYNQPGQYVAQLQLYASGKIVFAYDNTASPYATAIAGISAGGVADPGGVQFANAQFSDSDPAIYQLSAAHGFPLNIGVSFTPNGHGGYDVVGDPPPGDTVGANPIGGLVTSPTDAVPEPAAWALMIAGFGLAGATLRRRRVVAATA